MKRIRPKKMLMLTMLVALVSMMFSIQVSASDTKDTREKGALTTPPPKVEIKPYVTNPNFKYLYDATLTVSDLGSLKVKLQATTIAYETVSSIGADISIERWTGANWVTVQSTTLSSANTDYYNGSSNWIVTEGFYYRGKSNHWIKKGTIKEEHVVVTDSLLITKK